jgi:hypothetical protein
VGSYTDSSGNSQGLLLTETHGVWAQGIEATLPANAGSNPNASLGSVSCASPGDCTAVGSYRDSSRNEQGLLLSETAGTWATGVEAPLPANAGSIPFADSSVSCASPGDCTAVGSYFDSSRSEQGLLLSETAGTWATGVQATLPANAGSNPYVSLGSVSCASAGDCSAVGIYGPPDDIQGLLLSETSGTWATGVEATLPANAGPNPNVSLGSLSCTSPGDCTAVGNYVDSSYHEHGLLLSESSGTWQRGVEAAMLAKPRVSRASLHPKSFKAKRDIELKLTLSAVATVRFVVTRAGHKVKRVCKASAKKGKECQAKVKTLTFSGRAGRNTFKLKLKGLKPGSYTAVITASNSSGTSGQTKLRFKIKR